MIDGNSLTQSRRDAEKPWPMVKLGDVCDEIRERIRSDQIALENYIATDNMIKGCGGVCLAESKPCNVGLVSYKAGDVLLSNIRPYLKKVWCSDRNGGCSSDVIVIRSKTKTILSEYVYRALSQDEFFAYVMKNVSGTKMPRGKRSWIKDFTFPLPPLSIQQSIVARLDKGLAEVDQLKANFESIAKKADENFKATLAETFDNIQGEKVRLGDVATLKGGYAFQKSKYVKTGIQIVRISDLDGESISSENAAYYKPDSARSDFIIHNNCILICLTGSIGKMALVKDDKTRYLNQRVGMLRSSDDLSLLYVWYYLHTSEVIEAWNKNKTSVNGNLRNSDILDLTIPLPPLSVQQEVVAKLEVEKSRCEAVKSQAEKGIRACEGLRSALLREAFEQ